ncbi:DUF6798 domain-containing protein [Leptolyngbya sp. Heron Island J]|uniref:DUF6798 domain-containing protein n=1 Tax=Leptolyngbya sp. Heron Island J TaxID=1385935 RepID=UPI001378D9FE|nr:DUF6798 domain-containing protein [Leptolyngbya sp. Heron Island J]
MTMPPLLTQMAMALSGLVAYGYNFSKENVFNQMPAVMALVDPTLYNQDFYVQEMLQFTPRSYYYYALALPVKLGLSVPMVCFIYFAISFAGFSLGLYAIGRSLGQSKLAGAALAFLGLAVVDGTIGFTDVFRRSPNPSVYAIAIAVWGIYFCLQQQWIRGYVFFGVSCLLQFLIGLLPGVLFTPALIFYCLSNKRPKQLLGAWGALLILAGMVYSPMVLSGNTSSDLLSNSEFIWLYGYVRHPHHIIMSIFSVKGWWRFVHFLVAGLACLYGSRQLKPHHKITIGSAMLMGCGLVAIGYWFVEVYPIATVAKLQFARTTPFILLMALTAIAVYASEHYRRGNQALALLLIAAPVVDNYGGLTTLVVVILSLIKPGGNTFWTHVNQWVNRLPWLNYALFLIVLTVTYSFHLALFLSFAYPFLLEELPAQVKRLRPAAYVITAVCVLFVGLNLGGVIVHRSLGPVHRAIKFAPLYDHPVKKLGANFRDTAPADALVLVPPDDRMFRFYSQRSVVVSFKAFPFTDAGMVTWQQRMTAILGELPASVEAVLEDLFSQRTGAELGAIAAEFGATHILTRQAWHPDVPGTIIDQQDDWVLWAMNDTPA